MATSTSPSQRWQFSLYALLTLMLVASFAVSRVRVPNASWDNHALSVIAFLFVIGLLHQAWDLWSVHRRHAWQSTAERDGWIFAVGWRVGLCLWIAAVLVLDYLDAYGVISLAEPEEAMEQTGQLTRAALLRMTLLVALVGASKHRVSVRAPGFVHAFLTSLAGRCCWCSVS